MILLASSNAFAVGEVKVKSIDDSNITYPIKELGSCKDKADCASFCSKNENMVACMDFAEKQGLLSGEDLRISKIVAEKISKGQTPGACKDQDSCEKFCKDKVENINACISFAEELNILPANELAQAKNIAKALKEGAKLPGQCKTKDDCENYCEDGAHIDECLSFAEVANILGPDELKDAKKMASFLKSGETPGKCKDKKDCENYCNDSSNGDECLNFAKKAGLISKEEEDMMNNGGEKIKQALENLPPEVKGEVEACLNSKIGADKLDKVMNKEENITKNQGESLQSCFAGIEAKMKAIMMEKAGSQGKSEGFGAPEGMGPKIKDIQGGPDREDVQKMIPKGIPESASIPQVDCASFKAVPSCSYVPEGVRDQCEKCKE